MSKDKIKPEDNQSNMQNSNKGTDGINEQYQKVLDNRSKQLNPNQTKEKGK